MYGNWERGVCLLIFFFFKIKRITQTQLKLKKEHSGTNHLKFKG